MKLIFLSVVLITSLSFSSKAKAQVLDYNNKVDIVLDNGVSVTLFGRALTLNSGYSSEYYYLPKNLKLGKKPDGTPEFLFLKYTTEERVDQGGTQGAILHFMMEWGLTAEELAEAQTKLKAKLRTLGSAYAGITNPIIKGAIDVSTPDNGSFRVISATLSDDKSTRLITSGRAPTLPGAKVAVASRMDKYSAQLLAATFEKSRSISDISIEMTFKYNVLFPAVNGIIILDWEKINYSFENFDVEYSKLDQVKQEKYRAFYDAWCILFFCHLSTIERERTVKTGIKEMSYKTASNFYEYLQETKSINIKIDKNAIDSKIADDIIENFMSVFMSSISDINQDKESGDNNSTPGLRESSQARANAMIDSLRNIPEVTFSFNETKRSKTVEKKKETYQLSLRLAMPVYYAIRGNLAEWYDGVKFNKNCVNTVNLNDPFYRHRDINFIVDNKVKEVFEEEVNYVTVNVRKRRSVGNDFLDAKTIDLEYMKKNGALAQFTYARGEDRNADVYEYKIQWGLRGGVSYPENPGWQTGDWQGVTLTCPMVPREIEFEADLDEMRELGITRATLQLRYMKHGKEFESNIPLTVSRNESLVSKRLFIDENTPGYAYRLVLNHKEKGKLALDWETKINDDYVYATIPKKLKENDKNFWERIIGNGKNISEPNQDGSVKTGYQILDQFLNVIQIFINNK
jgi:hypothetical protein